jgi:hypothetical protein
MLINLTWMQSSEIRKIVRILDIVRSFHTRMHEMRVTSLGRGKLIQSFFRLLSRELTGEQLLAVRSRLQ